MSAPLRNRRWPALLPVLLLGTGLNRIEAVAAPALKWEAHSGMRSAALTVPAPGRIGFTSLPETQTGIAFTNTVPQWQSLTNQILLNGSGVAAGDIDGDGLCDVYLCGLNRPNALYRNLGDWKFQDIAEKAGVACTGLGSTGAALADIDGDGDLDLVVNTFGRGTHVFLNDGHGRFQELAVLNQGKGGTSLALGDVDGDGFLDLYVANYKTHALLDMPNTRFTFSNVDGRRVLSAVNGRPVTDPDLANRYQINDQGVIDENGEADALFHNVGGRQFTPISFTGGAFLDEDGRTLTATPLDWGLSVMIRDFNQDGLPDIWICNDFDSPDRTWINEGGGRFRAAPRLAIRKSSHFSMGIDVADINRDGYDDVFVVDMLSRDHVQRMDMTGYHPPAPPPHAIENRPECMMNTLFLNRGDGTYAEIAQLAGLAASEWSWAPIFLDVDLDGFEDLLIANGHERAARSMDVAEKLRRLRQERQLSAQEILENRKLFPRQNARNLAFRNRGDLTFDDVSAQWGFDFDGVSQGMCLADLDNDGDLDVIVNNLNDVVGIYRNESAAPRVAVRLKGLAPNTRGIGGRINVRGGAVPDQSQEILCGGRYLSSDDSIRVFAAGTMTNRMTIEVNWRSGRRSMVQDVKPNSVCEIEESAAPGTVAKKPAPAAPLFEDVSSRLNHVHVDDEFDDFARQPLLPHKLSQLGPGVSWCDLDGDGREDLVVGSGKGGMLAAYWNDGTGGFQRITDTLFNAPAGADQTGILKWTKVSGDTVLLVGSANYEEGTTNAAAVHEFNLRKSTVVGTVLGQVSSTGPMALADIDGDGHLDLFVGGRVTARRWPEPASSMLLRGNGEKFVLDIENTKRLAKIGLVSGAVFTDLTGDGLPELVLACEWGSLLVFRNDRGQFTLWDAPVVLPDSRTTTLSQLPGSWNGVTAGDLDGDGRLDLVVAGWGMNTPYQTHLAQPIELAYGDFNGDGVLEVVESYFDTATNKRVTERQMDFLARGLPFIKERFTSHVAFGRASLEEVLGSFAPVTRRLVATDFRSHILLNRGDRFELRPLPVEAQCAPAFAVCVADLDGDGSADVLLSQNFFNYPPGVARDDGGLGLLLKNDGRGGFKAVSAAESGIRVFGEQRATAVCDFDGDGRLDFVMSQNGAETKLFHNAGARPGLRVRLRGTAGNAEGIGAVVRRVNGDSMGPAWEVHSGSGYWSQESPVQMLAGELPARVWTRWPGGRTNLVEIPTGTLEVTIPMDGPATFIRQRN